MTVNTHLDLAALQTGVGELGELTDSLSFIEHVALLADGPEVISQQCVQGIDVGVQLGLVEGTMELLDVWHHRTDPADRAIGTKVNR